MKVISGMYIQQKRSHGRGTKTGTSEVVNRAIEDVRLSSETGQTNSPGICGISGLLKINEHSVKDKLHRVSREDAF